MQDSQINELEEANIDCSGCLGYCCKMDWLIRLTTEEIKYLEYEEKYGLYLLKKKENSTECIYQDKNGKCTVWDRRPKVCRHFDCRMDNRKIPFSKYK